MILYQVLSLLWVAAFCRFLTIDAANLEDRKKSYLEYKLAKKIKKKMAIMMSKLDDEIQDTMNYLNQGFGSLDNDITSIENIVAGNTVQISENMDSIVNNAGIIASKGEDIAINNAAISVNTNNIFNNSVDLFELADDVTNNTQRIIENAKDISNIIDINIELTTEESTTDSGP